MDRSTTSTEPPASGRLRRGGRSIHGSESVCRTRGPAGGPRLRRRWHDGTRAPTRRSMEEAEMRRRRSLPWPVRSVLAGFAGTAAMVLAYRLGHELRPEVDRPLDYDDSLV